MLVQKDIAKELNLSVATVSRSLRNDSGIPAKTRARVIELAARNGYRAPVRKTRQINDDSRNNMSIGVLIKLRENEKANNSAVTQGYLAGICRHAQELNVSVNVHYIYEKDMKKILLPEYQPAFMCNNEVRGLVLVHRFKDEIVRKLTRQWPCVILSNRVYDVDVDYISADNDLAMHSVVSYLVELGHKRIVFFTYEKDSAWARSRMSGFVEAMISHELDFSKESIFYCKTRVEDAPDYVDDIIMEKINSGVTAFVCGNDCAGYDVIGRLQKKGIDVPGRISVTGFDDLALFSGLPKLTSFAQEYDYMGEETIKCLRQRIECPQMPLRHISVQARMVIGESTGRIKQKEK